MAKGLPLLKHEGLDDLLEYFNFVRRGEDEHHEAIKDCELLASVYMAMLNFSKKKAPTLGFAKD